MTTSSEGAQPDRQIRIGFAVLLALLVLALFPYTGDPAGDVKDLLTSWGAFLLGGGWLLASWRGRLPFRRPRLFGGLLLVFLALNLLATLRSDYVAFSLIEMRRYWVLLLLYFVASQVYRTPEEVRGLMLALCGAVSVAAVYGLCQKAGLEFFPWGGRTSEEYLNLPATFGNPNYAAHTLVLAIIMSAFLVLERRLLWCLGLTVLLMGHLYFTHQRAGVLALLGAAVLVVVSKRVGRAVKRPVRAAVISLVLVGALGMLGLLGIMAVTKIRTGNAYPLDLSLLVRYKSYCSAARMVLDRPLLGYGPGVYRIEYPRFWTPYEQNWFAQELKMNAHVHNDALEIAIDAGLLAAGVYLAFLILAVGYGILMGYRRRDPLARALGFTFAALFMAFLVDGCFGFNLRVPVSAAILFVMAGAMEGIAAPRAVSARTVPLGGWSRAWRVVAVVLAAWCVISDSRVFASEVFLQLGKRQALRRNYDTAMRLLARGEALAPWDWRFAREQGLACLTRRDLDAAVRHLERSLDKNPLYIVTMVALARAKMAVAAIQYEAAESAKVLPIASPALDEGVAHARRALELCPKYAPAEGVWGRLLALRAMQLTKAYGAAGPYAEAIAENWREAEGHVTRAILFGAARQGDLYRLLALARSGLGDVDGTEQALVRSAQASPADDETWAYFYQFARGQGRFDELRDTLLGQIRRMAESPEYSPESIAGAQLWLAVVCDTGYNDADGAERAYQEAVRRAPLCSEVWTAYAGFAQRTDRVSTFLTALLASYDRVVADQERPLPQVEAVVSVARQGAQALPDAATLLVGALDALPDAPTGKRTAEGLRWAADLLLSQARTAPDDAPGKGPALRALATFYTRIDEANK